MSGANDLSGHMLIAGDLFLGGNGVTAVADPASGRTLEPEFGLASPEDVDRAVRAADKAFDTFRSLSPAQRADLLDDIAQEIAGDTDILVARALKETGLPEARLRGEVGRTTTQLAMFARLLRDGGSLGVRIDPGLPERQPAPRPDIRQVHVPLGPVVVFGASNFPFAFSTAGGDTASALAAGCPVIVKTHMAHGGTSMLVARAIGRAVRKSGLPGGVFSALIGADPQIGQQLVAHPLVAAVGFTGSRAGGTALTRIAGDRPVPIPVYAEMSSINPVVLLQGALGTATAEGFVGSLTLGSGQFCTNPGLVFVPAGADGDRFVADVAMRIGAASGQTMLTAGICAAFGAHVGEAAAHPDVRIVATGATGTSENAPAPTVLETTSTVFADDPALQAEMFGAASLIVRYTAADDLHAALRSLEGQLTATLHGDAELEEAAIAELLKLLERKAGRLILNGWPTGVEVTPAMVHGGPYPATSDGRSTSVGTLAITRFQRPVAYQSLPEHLLPAPLKAENPWRQSRLVDGRIEPA